MTDDFLTIQQFLNRFFSFQVNSFKVSFVVFVFSLVILIKSKNFNNSELRSPKILIISIRRILIIYFFSNGCYQRAALKLDAVAKRFLVWYDQTWNGLSMLILQNSRQLILAHVSCWCLNSKCFYERKFIP